MQEILEDGTMGETHVENTIEDLLPHIKKSLENQKVAYVKVYRGKTMVDERSKPGTKVEKRVVAIEELKEKKPAEIIEDFLPETLSDPRKK